MKKILIILLLIILGAFAIKKNNEKFSVDPKKVLVTASNDRIYYETVPLSKLNILKTGTFLLSIQAPRKTRLTVYDMEGKPVISKYYANRKYSFPEVRISKIKLNS